MSVLIPLAPIALGLVVASSGGAAVPVARESAPLYRPVASRTAPAPHPPAPGSGGAIVAVLGHPVEMAVRPGGPPLARLELHTPFGSPTVLLVGAQRPGWLGVLSPQAGNGRLGWIPASAAALARIDFTIAVSLARRQLTVLQAGRPVERYTVAIGMPSAPTPTGRFSVTDRLAPGDPSGPYGCCILALSALAPHAIQDWSGGDRIAIHSTTETSSIGKAVSHGCLRLTLAEGRWLLEHIPLGTPTVITDA